jgi:hypothetical protein
MFLQRFSCACFARVSVATAAVLVVAACAPAAQMQAGSSRPDDSAPSSSTSAPAETAAPACPPATLGIQPGPPLTPQTGEHGVILAVSSTSPTPCTVNGYPTVTFLRGKTPIPFVYLEGKGQYVTHQAPAPVTVGAGATAYFLVAKYRCDIGDAEQSDGATVTLTHSGSVHAIPGSWLSGLFSLCSGNADPGNTVAVSPFEPSVRLLSG